MSNKPDRNTLLAYHYGECEPQEAAKVKAYLAAHPEARQILSEWQDTRNRMQAFEAPAIIPPKIRPVAQPVSMARPMWKSTWLRVAAAVSLMFLTAALTDMQVHWAGSELRISWGETQEERAITKKNNEWLAEWQAFEANQKAQSERQSLQWQGLQAQLTQLEGKLNRVPRRASLSQAQLDQLSQTLLTASYEQLAGLLQRAHEANQSYTEEVLNRFAEFVLDQRAADLNLIEAALNEVLQRNDQRQAETDILLTQLFTQLQNYDTYN